MSTASPPSDEDDVHEGPEGSEGPDGVEEEISTGELFRRLLVFQFKLLLDGGRDLILSPVSIIAVLLGVFGGGARRDGPFRDLLRLGRQTDRWIDLFEAHAEETEETEEARDRPQASANALFDAVERAVREEYEGGGGRAAIEARLRGLREAQRRGAAGADRAPEDASPGEP